MKSTRKRSELVILKLFFFVATVGALQGQQYTVSGETTHAVALVRCDSRLAYEGRIYSGRMWAIALEATCVEDEAPVELAELPDQIEYHTHSLPYEEPAPAALPIWERSIWERAEPEDVRWNGKPSCCREFPKLGPFDVPAIQVMECFDPNGKVGGSVPCGTYTCADRSRFLLMDEFGTRHCLQLGGK